MFSSDYLRIRSAVLVAMGTATVAIPFPTSATSGLEYILATPVCIVGLRNDDMLRACAEKFPAMREDFDAGVTAWRTRNTHALQQLSAYCDQGLSKLYRDLRIDQDGISRVRRAANRVMETMRASMGEAQCWESVHALKTYLITPEEIEKSARIPLTLTFMQGIDPEFLREPPVEVNANYQRDRKLHFAESYTLFTALRIGFSSLDRNCMWLSLDRCFNSYKDVFGLSPEPNRRERVPSGDEKVTFLGKKTLFQGTFSDNHPAGLEERVFILRQGRIADAWQRMQFFDRGWDFVRPPRYSCEPFGGRVPATSICFARSIDVDPVVSASDVQPTVEANATTSMAPPAASFLAHGLRQEIVLLSVAEIRNLPGTLWFAGKGYALVNGGSAAYFWQSSTPPQLEIEIRSNDPILSQCESQLKQAARAGKAFSINGGGSFGGSEISGKHIGVFKLDSLSKCEVAARR